MKQPIVYKIILLLVAVFSMAGCSEQYNLQTNTFDDALVIEATITNEYKKQQIKISRTYRFEAEGPVFESGAEVNITDDQGNQYDFEEQSGLYVSEEEFQAAEGSVYRLNITTREGKTYHSSQETMTAVNNMQSVTPNVKTKNGQRGVQIDVKSFDPSGASRYYRYEYEETYKIIAPKWDDERTVLSPFVPGEPQGVIIIPRTGESQTCFTTKNSDQIILTSTNGLSEDRVDFPLRFISNQDYIITHRYSILVRQYVQTLASFTFYKTLKELSGSGSILSQNQPGFFYGNLRSEDNPDEKVIGFFEVSSVSSQRIFFNYGDLFPGEALPPYFMDCTEREFKYCFDQQADPDCLGAVLVSIVGSNSMVFVDGNPQYFFMVPPPCGDCTSFSSNIKPLFWID